MAPQKSGFWPAPRHGKQFLAKTRLSRGFCPIFGGFWALAGFDPKLANASTFWPGFGWVLAKMPKKAPKIFLKIFEIFKNFQKIYFWIVKKFSLFHFLTIFVKKWKKWKFFHYTKIEKFEKIFHFSLFSRQRKKLCKNCSALVKIPCTKMHFLASDSYWTIFRVLVGFWPKFAAALGFWAWVLAFRSPPSSCSYCCVLHIIRCVYTSMSANKNTGWVKILAKNPQKLLTVAGGWLGFASGVYGSRKAGFWESPATVSSFLAGFELATPKTALFS